MISKSKEFIFIHITKTAGSSIGSTIHQYLDNNIYVDKGKDIGCIVNKHESLSEAKSLLSKDDFDKYFKFTVVRNPYDRLVSLYEFRKQVEADKKKIIPKEVTFDEYVKIATDEKYRDASDISWHKHCCPSPMIEKFLKTDVFERTGVVEIDRFIRFENLVPEWNEVCDLLNINSHLPHIYKTKRKHFTEYFDNNQELIQRVEQFYRVDFDYLGYRFDPEVNT